ncbi:hypothetical protein [Marinobacter sp.]|uniref:hypothetical protein n=1 Tax=Marinobacter sp. TaxID=50741 RepID=UPI0035667938
MSGELWTGFVVVWECLPVIWHRQAVLPGSEVNHYPVGHFDVYRGEALVQLIEDQLDFLPRSFQ